MTTFKQTKTYKFINSLFSDNNLTQKAYMNAISAGLDYFARLVTGFLVTPFLVRGLGDALYGIFKTLGNLTGYLSAASGRPSQALKFTTASRQTSTDYDEKRRNVASALIVWLLFLPLMAILGGVIVWYAPFWIKDLPFEQYGLVRIAAGILALDMIITTITVLPQSVLEGENAGYKRMGMSAMLVVLGSALAVLALYLKTGLLGVCVAEITTTIITGVFFLWVVRSYVPWFGLARPSWPMVRQFFGLSGWFLAWRLVMQLMTASDLLILGVYGSAQLVTIYSLTKYAPETLINIVAIVVFGSTPGLGGIIGAGQLKKAARVRGEIMLLTWLVTVIIGAALLLWNRSFMNLWVGSSRYAGSLPNLLILLVTVQFILIRNDANIIDLTLKLSKKVLLGALSAAISIGLAALLVGYFDMGMLGLVIGLIAGRSVLSLAYPILIGRFLGVAPFDQVKSVLRPALITAALFFASVKLETLMPAESFFSSTWIGLFLSVSFTAILATFASFFLGLTRSQQRQIFDRVRYILANVNQNKTVGD